MPEVDLEYLKLEVFGKRILSLTSKRHNKDHIRPREADDPRRSGHRR